VLAKELASLDVVSGGRLLFGVGVGYLEPEFRALGISFEHKGARTNEYIEAIRALWVQSSPSFDGRFVKFSGIDAMPRPLAKPHPPIVIGGMSPPSLRRAVRVGNGWYGFNMNLEETAARVAALREAATRVERPAELGRLEITVTPPPMSPLDLDLARRYRDLGVDRLVPYPLAGSVEDLLTYVDRAGTDLIGHL
jgi:alkanesulfonate monooxygenase SsuD/methylene tetrahydromethanopterin reductase-like flavin-dependent oxidoreductase (luciferase family)